MAVAVLRAIAMGAAVAGCTMAVTMGTAVCTDVGRAVCTAAAAVVAAAQQSCHPQQPWQ